MNKILSRTDLPSSEKVKLYDNVLQRYMVYKNKLDHSIKKFALRKRNCFLKVNFKKFSKSVYFQSQRASEFHE